MHHKHHKHHQHKKHSPFGEPHEKNVHKGSFYTENPSENQREDIIAEGELGETNRAQEVGEETNYPQGTTEVFQESSLGEGLGKNELEQKWEKKLQEQKNEFLLRAAEMENFKKRLLKDKEEFGKYAGEKILSDVIVLMDELELAFSSLENVPEKNDTQIKVFFEGIKMIKEKFLGILESKHHLKRFGKKGEVFDPNLHEALAFMDVSKGAGSSKEHIVGEVYQPGYMLSGKVIRGAKVKVESMDQA